MNINIEFTAIARCKKYDNRNLDKNIVEKEDIELTFNSTLAEKFLFRFSQPSFLINEYKMTFKYTNTGLIKSIVLIKDDYIYFVTNSNQLVNNIIEGYNKIKTLENINNIISIENNINQEEKIEDEFGE